MINKYKSTIKIINHTDNHKVVAVDEWKSDVKDLDVKRIKRNIKKMIKLSDDFNNCMTLHFYLENLEEIKVKLHFEIDSFRFWVDGTDEEVMDKYINPQIDKLNWLVEAYTHKIRFYKKEGDEVIDLETHMHTQDDYKISTLLLKSEMSMLLIEQALKENWELEWIFVNNYFKEEKSLFTMEAEEFSESVKGTDDKFWENLTKEANRLI